MPIGKVRIKTLRKLLKLCTLTKEKNRILTIDEIRQEIECCKNHAYNYQRALRHLYPPESFDPNRPRELAQECLM